MPLSRGREDVDADDAGTIRLPGRRRRHARDGPAERGGHWASSGVIESADPAERRQRDRVRAGDLLLRLPRSGAGAGVASSFDPREFLFSTEWYPTSAIDIRYGTLALIVGTVSVTLLAMVMAVPFGLGAAIFVSEFCAPAHRRKTLKIVIELLAAIPSVVWGFIGLTVHEPRSSSTYRRAGRPQRAERRHHPRADERADHRLDRRGRAEGGARLVPRGRHRHGRHAVAAGLPRPAARRAQRPAGGRAPRRRAAPSARRWPC